MTTTKTSTGHTLTYRSRNPLWLEIGGEAETMQQIPDAEIHAFATRLGLEWRGDVADETTLVLGMPAGAIARLRTEAVAAGDMEQVRICDEALGGDAEAILDCARVIADAKAQEG